MSNFPQYKQALVSDLIPYARNARTHSDAQVDKIAASIREFGFLNPVITDGENGIVAGHGRVMAAKKLGMDEVPSVEAAHLSDAQKRAYILADNRLALDAGWDDELLRVEFADLKADGFDLDLTGFDPGEIEGLDPEQDGTGSGDDNPYTSKVDAPHYEPSGEKPSLDAVYDNSKALGMIEDIRNSGLPEDEKNFLMAAASRHIVFNFEEIAEYYAHSSAECQMLMEDSALVIIDFDKAISNGYVKLNEQLSELFSSEKDADDE